MSPWTGAGAWAVEILVVAALSGSRTGAGIGVVVAVAFLAVPAFVEAPPIVRFLLAIGAIIGLLRALDFWRDGPPGAFAARLRHLALLFDTRLAAPRRPGLDPAAGARLAVAGITFLAAFAVVRSAAALPDAGRLPVRWLAGAVMGFAGFEALVALMLGLAALFGLRPPVLHDRPYVSRSLTEFWGRRWNRVVSGILRDRCYQPVARWSPGLGMIAAFAASALIHAYAAAVSLGSVAAAAWFTFFMAQPALIAAERGLGARRWPPLAGRAWTAAALAVVAPLFLEPFVRLFE